MDFASHYRSLSDEHLEELEARKSSLTDEARSALRDEIASRGISLVRMRESNQVADAKLKPPLNRWRAMRQTLPGLIAISIAGAFDAPPATIVLIAVGAMILARWIP